MNIRIAIVDDHQLVIEGLEGILAKIDQIEIVGHANNGIDLIDLMSKCDVDLILMDISMPIMDGISSTKKVKEEYPETKVIILSMHDSVDQTQKALDAGADGFVLKNSSKDELERAILTVMDGKNFYSDKIMKNVMEAMKADKVEKVVLTEREEDVLRLIAKEYTTKEIADQLFISHHTVESHRKNLLFKLDARGVAGLVKYAVENGYIEE